MNTSPQYLLVKQVHFQNVYIFYLCLVIHHSNLTDLVSADVIIEQSSNEHIDLVTLFVSWQKMDKNRDGVVTIDEFIDCCQNVSLFLVWMWCCAWMSFLKTFTRGFSWVERKAPYSLSLQQCHHEDCPLLKCLPVSICSPQDENIMRSMQLFENVI